VGMPLRVTPEFNFQVLLRVYSNSVYWRRIKREKVNSSPKPKQKSCGKKRSVPNPLQEIDPNAPISKKAKGKEPVGKKYERKENADGGKVEAVVQPHRAQ